METIALKNNLPLTLDDVIGLESDLQLLETFVKMNNAEMPQRQKDRIHRIRNELDAMRVNKSLNWWKYKFPKSLGE